jgi:hypothetical protein
MLNEYLPFIVCGLIYAAVALIVIYGIRRDNK